MRVLVCGGRNYTHLGRLYWCLDSLHHERGFTLLIAGGARGADTLAAEWAAARNVPFKIYMAEWKRLGRKAGPIRNERMLNEGKPELVVAFPGGRGTAHMTRIAREAGVEVIEIPSTTYMIDDPSPWDPIAEWKDFLRDMYALPHHAPEVKGCRTKALRQILELQRQQLCVPCAARMRARLRDGG
jgi:hypothetical protein